MQGKYIKKEISQTPSSETKWPWMAKGRQGWSLLSGAGKTASLASAYRIFF